MLQFLKRKLNASVSRAAFIRWANKKFLPLAHVQSEPLLDYEFDDSDALFQDGGYDLAKVILPIVFCFF